MNIITIMAWNMMDIRTVTNMTSNKLNQELPKCSSPRDIDSYFDCSLSEEGSDKVTEVIKLWGIVQGVGFRPFVARIADEMGMQGQVINIGGLVEVRVTSDVAMIDKFVERITNEKPGPSEIVHIRRSTVKLEYFEGFTIEGSGEGDDEVAMIPADLAVCNDCLSELRTEGNHRFRHPFISCMACGPRYTIIDRIPYDRENTSMIDWPMCDICTDEYTDLHNRRYHAQTVSCHDCGPQLIFRSREGSEYHGEDSIDKAAEILNRGGVLAFKSMGGYNLMADPLNPEAVKLLRITKNREQKPFALLFRSIEEIRKYCTLSEIEERLITSSARPIMLLEHNSKGELDEVVGSKSSEELMRSRFIGSFLPSMGGQYLLLDAFGGPLIATSANVSGLPIIRDDEEMMNLMNHSTHIEGVLYNERAIRIRIDDSVVRVIDEQPQIIRRSKGYAPVPLYIDCNLDKEHMIFAAGAQLKNSFALTKGSFAYVSQYFGDLDSLESQRLYMANVERMSKLFRIKPTFAVCDMHPLYESTVFAEHYSREHDIPLIKVQHHHAHVASVMAEHNLQGQVIGVSMDGTGYGTDGCIWGGEFLICEGASMRRRKHLKYVSMIGGDGSMREGWKSALCYRYAYDNCIYNQASDHEIVPDLSRIMDYNQRCEGISDNRQLIYSALDNNINTIQSSSMGRLFDAVASLLGICHNNGYEGQCAIMLEDAAARAICSPGACEADDLALIFHRELAQIIYDTCCLIRSECGACQVALTGGVWQNRILMEETLALLRSAGFEPYYNISVSPNDGGIALGQSYIAMQTIELM